MCFCLLCLLHLQVCPSGLEGEDHNLSHASVAVPKRFKSDSDIERCK